MSNKSICLWTQDRAKKQSIFFGNDSGGRTHTHTHREREREREADIPRQERIHNHSQTHTHTHTPTIPASPEYND